ncbi:MAG: ATP-binding protein [Bacteroidetes bacterium MedPE-SWsnd-G1]|nr:MAG: ATP-binding protein [Bacteroidetes bacterium MedPE-SWsnd-G1]
MTTKAYFNWSSGKDASIALYKLIQQQELHIDLLVTTINKHYNRVSMHGLPKGLLEAQAKSITIPLHCIELPENPDMDTYNAIMTKEVTALKEMGYENCVFGDIFLEDLRNYREQQLKGIQCHFPLWKKDTTDLLQEFIDLGFKAIIVCCSDSKLGKEFIGKEIDNSFLDTLPKDVDPCGENGEFHTFCYDGPIFKHPIKFSKGETILRKYPDPKGGKSVGFWFQDLITN